MEVNFIIIKMTGRFQNQNKTLLLFLQHNDKNLSNTDFYLTFLKLWTGKMIRTIILAYLKSAIASFIKVFFNTIS